MGLPHRTHNPRGWANTHPQWSRMAARGHSRGVFDFFPAGSRLSVDARPSDLALHPPNAVREGVVANRSPRRGIPAADSSHTITCSAGHSWHRHDALAHVNLPGWQALHPHLYKSFHILHSRPLNRMHARALLCIPPCRRTPFRGISAPVRFRVAGEPAR